VETLFWSDSCLGGVPLSERYPRLFNLSLHRLSTVAEISVLGWEAGGAVVRIAPPTVGVGGRAFRAV
jgi:hypothetical protein